MDIDPFIYLTDDHYKAKIHVLYINSKKVKGESFRVQRSASIPTLVVRLL